MIREGGDTDTNAAIVGGMVGALLGVKQLDETMVKKVLTFDCTRESNRRRRPEFLNT